MTEPTVLVRYDAVPRAVVSESVYYGLRSFDLAGPPRRLYSDGFHAPPLLEQYVDTLKVTRLATPASLLSALPAGDSWLALSARSLARLHALFLIAEDPQERLVGRAAATLAHQASLVRFVLATPGLRRVLIADEVGLGKTIEAGLIIRSLLEQRPGLRILYLAPARLVSNVYREFRDKLDLQFRMYSADESMQADMATDPLIIASIHRAVHSANRDVITASAPWDVIVVDECHHLSAHGPNGQNANEHYALVRDLVRMQPPESRLLLLSGTPHQGHRQRFENLLLLLREPDDQARAETKRVIFRTKEHVRDWEGKPLFPRREVRPPRLIDMGESWRRWYEAVGALYDDVPGTDARRRAGGWAKGQALQWVASSVPAGMGFIVRLAMRRLGWNLSTPGFREAVASLRPYKGGPATESPESLFTRLSMEISRQRAEQDLSDMEEDEEGAWRPPETALRRLIAEGLALIQSPAATSKWGVLLQLLKETPHEKIVMFAQPVETVTSLVSFLKADLSEPVAMIIGGQKESERDAEITAFRRVDGPRLLVSSRAGGEGINLQVSRRLIHLDVPWNPMEMEQRVGRVHRFGSHRTILVDTLLVKGTREVDAYQVARAKLATAFGDLAKDPEQFDLLYSRVMSLVPPQALEEVISRPIIGENADRLGSLVEEGLKAWREFDSRFAEQSKAVRDLESGAATWSDLADFMKSRAGAAPIDGYAMPDFREEDGELVTVRLPVPALRIDGKVFACTDTKGIPVTDDRGRTIPSLGINVEEVAQRIRDAVLHDSSAGAAWLRLRDGDSELDSLLPEPVKRPFGVLACMRQTLRTGLGNVAEAEVSLHVNLVSSHGTSFALAKETMPAVVRALLCAARQREPDAAVVADWSPRVSAAEAAMIPQLGRPSAEEHAAGVRHAVWPVFAAVVV